MTLAPYSQGAFVIYGIWGDSNMHWMTKISIGLIYYIIFGAVVVIVDLIRYYEEYTDNLADMLYNLDPDMRDSVENSEFVALEICARMLFNEVLIWPLVFVARMIDIMINGDENR